MSQNVLPSCTSMYNMYDNENTEVVSSDKYRSVLMTL